MHVVSFLFKHARQTMLALLTAEEMFSKEFPLQNSENRTYKCKEVQNFCMSVKTIELPDSAISQLYNVNVLTPSRCW
jgi:hypothetical protein